MKHRLFLFLSYFILTITFVLPFNSAQAAPCPIGESSSDGQTPCTPCAMGTFQDQTGQTSCTPCSAGSYQDQTSASTCINCDAGTYQDTAGQSTCTSCSTGQFATNMGSDSCTICTAGSFQDSTGGIDCTECPADTYSEDGASACITCDTGTYADAGSSSCTALCGDDIVAGSETCDDGNTDLNDGCSDVCAYETQNDLESANLTITFDDLSVDQTLSLSSPSASGDSRDSSCSCLWTITPSSVAEILNPSLCTTHIHFLTQGQANLALDEDCSESGQSSYNQTLIIAHAASTPSASSGCSLSYTAPFSSFGSFEILISFLSILVIYAAYRIKTHYE